MPDYPVANHTVEDDMKKYYENIKKLRSAFFCILCD